jgi:putative hydroxymethylpyrimidine transport system substrate-binding protein
MKQGGLVAAVVVAIALLAGCGGSEASKTISVRQPGKQRTSQSQAETPRPESSQVRAAWVALDGWETAETLGLVMAEKRGYFQKSRLAVTTLAPITPALSIPDVLKGSDLIAVAPAPQAVIARAKGAPVVVVGSLVSQPTAAMIWLKRSNVDGIAGLKGKTIAIPGLSFQRDFLERVLARGGLTLEDVKVMKVGNELVPALVKGRADAIFGGSGNLEGADLEARGLEPVITPVRDLGFPSYEELVLVAREDQVSEFPELMHDFVAAVARGAAAAADNPKGAADALGSAGEHNFETGPRARAAEVGKTVGLLSRSGRVSPDEMEGLVDWMYEAGIIQSKVPVSQLLASP